MYGTSIVLNVSIWHMPLTGLTVGSVKQPLVTGINNGHRPVCPLALYIQYKVKRDHFDFTAVMPVTGWLVGAISQRFHGLLWDKVSIQLRYNYLDDLQSTALCERLWSTDIAKLNNWQIQLIIFKWITNKVSECM